MSVNYYLFCKNSYDKIISNLENIINTFEDIDEITKEEKDLLQSEILLSKQRNNKNFFNSKKKDMQILRNLCKKKILQLCEHNFIEDTIDITPDKSITIKYCEICEYTDPN